MDRKHIIRLDGADAGAVFDAVMAEALKMAEGMDVRAVQRLAARVLGEHLLLQLEAAGVMHRKCSAAARKAVTQFCEDCLLSAQVTVGVATDGKEVADGQ